MSWIERILTTLGYSIMTSIVLMACFGIGLSVFGNYLTPKHPVYSAPVSGTELVNGYHRGTGELKVINGSNNDAIVKVAAGDQLVREFYVKANEWSLINEIPNGCYKVAFATGHEYDQPKQDFFDGSYAVFDKNLDYNESKYMITYTLTLNPVPDGNVKTTTMTRNQFINIQ